MEQEYSKDLIWGNFSSGGTFPLDCETLAMMQSDTRKMALLGKILGRDRVILTGCEVEDQRRGEGYVYVGGEILHHASQIASTHCYVEETQTNVTADNVTYTAAYSTRKLTEGTRDGAMPWNTFTKVSDLSNDTLRSKISVEQTARSSKDTELETALEGKAPKFRIVTKQFANDGSDVTPATFSCKDIICCDCYASGVDGYHYTSAIKRTEGLMLNGIKSNFTSTQLHVLNGNSLKDAMGVNHGFNRVIFTYIENV